jgi:collagenase-like PrtC family protease
MAFSIATTFDYALLDNLVKLNQGIVQEGFKIEETFGAMITEFGSGRNAYRLPNINQETLERYIQYSHKNNLGFNYLVNGTCFSGEESSKRFINKFCKHLDELLVAGVDIFTFANPILVRIAKENIPEARVNTSINSRINTLEEVQRYLALGIDRLTIHYDQNRDFEFLKRVRAITDAEIELLANNPCLHNCIYADAHVNMDSHGSTDVNKPVNTLFPVFNCKNSRLTNPEEIIKSRWIRPADVRNYFDLGIDIVKIAGRNMDNKWLLNAAEEYAQERDSPGFYSRLIERGLWKYVSKKNPMLDKLDLEVELPKDFLNWFASGKCKQDCAKCGYCANMAERGIRFNSESLREDYIRLSKQILIDEAKRE